MVRDYRGTHPGLRRRCRGGARVLPRRAGLGACRRHDGWLIFRTGASELGVHPAGDGPRHHEISLMCDDIETTIEDLTAKGAEFAGGIENASFGRTTLLKVPGAGEMLVYEPRHPTAYDL